MSRLICAVLTALTLACGGGDAPAADENKTPAEVKQQATTMEAPELEQTVSAYQEKVEQLTAEVEDLKAQLTKKLEEVAGEGLGGLLGEDGGLSEEAKAQADALKKELADLEGRWKDLVAKLNIYIEELGSRGEG